MPQSFLRCGVFLSCFRRANFYVLLVSAILNSTFGRLHHPKVHFARGQPLEPRPPFLLRSKNRPQNPKRLFERGSKPALIPRRLIFYGSEKFTCKPKRLFASYRLLGFVAVTACCCGGNFSAACTTAVFVCSARFRSIV